MKTDKAGVKNLIKVIASDMDGMAVRYCLSIIAWHQSAAIETPFQAFGGEELYLTMAKGTRLSYGLIKNHYMLDGNNV